MLRTNLSTRPFYNDRSIRIGIAALVVVVAALTAFNVLQVASLNSRSREMSEREKAAEAVTAQFRDRARATTQALNQEEVGAVQAAAREANLLIERRAFSWTDLFNRFEETMPPDVRITGVQPQIDQDGRMLVAVTVVARRIEDLHIFLDQLESTGAFGDLISRQDVTNDEGLWESIVQGYYHATPVTATVPASSTSDINGSSSTRASSNASAAGPAGSTNGSPAAPREQR